MEIVNVFMWRCQMNKVLIAWKGKQLSMDKDNKKTPSQKYKQVDFCLHMLNSDWKNIVCQGSCCLEKLQFSHYWCIFSEPLILNVNRMLFQDSTNMSEWYLGAFNPPAQPLADSCMEANASRTAFSKAWSGQGHSAASTALHTNTSLGLTE